jgi:hypothetical protein
MAYSARFRSGSKTLDLSEGNALSLGPGFVPPGLSALYNISTGTSANRLRGGKLEGERYQNRSWSFPVRIAASGEQHAIALARALTSFLERNKRDLFLEWNGSGLPAPLWGQFGADLRFRVVTVDYSISGMYAEANARGLAFFLPLRLTVEPFPYGPEQRLCTATGGVIVDTLGMADGHSRGLIIPEATTNKMTNPVFGNGLTGWTTNAGLTAVLNTDKEYLYPGASASVKIVSKAATNNSCDQTINVGNTNTHTLTAYVVRPDRGKVTTNDIILRYTGAQTTTIRHIGNGVYRARATFSGVNEATSVGVIVGLNRTIYLLGMQLEEKGYATPLCWGDLLGCAWTSTAHASTSTRAAGVCRMPTADLVNAGAGTIFWVWKASFASTFGADAVFWKAEDSNFRALFTQAADALFFSDATNNTTSPAQVFADDDIIVFAASWGQAGIYMYKNGVEIGSNATYTQPALGDYIAIGSNNGSNHTGGVYMGFTLFRDQLTAAQVAAVSEEMAAVAAQGQLVDWIPFLWTKDGDDILDNCDDSTHDNWGVCGGIPGVFPARTKFHLYALHFWLGNHVDHLDDWLSPDKRFYMEGAGAAEAGNSAGNYEAMTAATPRAELSIIPQRPANLEGNFHFFSVEKSDSGTITAQAAPYITTNNGNLFDDDVTIDAVDTEYRLHYLGKLAVEKPDNIDAADRDLEFHVTYSPNGGATLRVDFAMAINGSLQHIRAVQSSLPGGGGVPTLPNDITLRGREAVYNAGDFLAVVEGDEAIELYPDAYNTLQVVIGLDNDGFNQSGATTFDVITVEPRYALL